MQKVILIDDEKNARDSLSVLLQEYFPELEIAAQCSSVPEAVLAINKHNPDIVFLDIEMPEYNGFELLDFFKEITFQIIFVTAYDHYAVKAFEVSATDYLLKPIDIEHLKSSVKKAISKIHSENITERIQLMKDVYSGTEIQKIALPMSNGLLFVELSKIAFFEADRAYTNVYWTDGSKLTVSKAMRTFEDILDNRSYFFRPHRSYLINLHHIKQYIRGDSNIIMDNLQSIPISRERKSDFENLLKELRMMI